MRVYPTSVFILSVAATATLTFGQGRPQPQAPPTPQAIQEMFPDGLTNDDEGNVIEGARRPGDTNPNRLQTIDENELVPLSMSDVDVKDLFGWLAENTGKVVIPIDLPALNIKKIQIRSAQPVPRWKALDLVIEAMRLNKIGIIEKEDILIIGDATQIQGQARTPLLGPDVDISTRIDTGTVVIKVFQVEQVDVEALNESLQDFVPDTATLTVDPNSNKILVHGDLGLCQQIDRMITQLDVNYVKEVTRTFRLKYADASEIADNISELFQEDGASANRNTGVRRTNTNNQRGRQTANAATAGPPGPQVELVQTVNINTNSVTVKADKSRIQKIEELITYQWDLPRPAGTSRVYVLEHTDPVVMRDTLQTVLGQGGTSRPGATRTATGGGGGQRADVSQIVSGIYRIEAYPDKNALVVLCKTEESFDFLDGLISELDQPSTVGLPVVVPLKHANAIELTEELNVLLADAGGGSLALERPETGLSMENVSSLSEGSGDSGSTTESGQINFPWASNRGQNAADATANSPSSLIGKVRIVPIVRQNALAILAPPAQREAVRDLIHYFDRPGRQVMISAIIAEVDLVDDLQLGLRVSAGDIALSNIDNSIGGSGSGSGQETGFLDDLFDTSVLDVNFDANIVLQALAQQTNVRILQEPRVFTADNQEALFFDGQDVPFISNSNTTDQGGITQSFDYLPVGVVLNVRPRITSQNDVDMEINLELSSIVPGQTLFGGFIIDRRQTTTQVIIKDQQTIVLSGILKDTESRLTRKVPLLGDIPLLGELFTSRDNTTTTSELLVFITPVVVDNPAANYEMNAPDLETLEQFRNTSLEDTDKLLDTMDRKIDRRITPPAASRNITESSASTAPAALPVDIDDVNGDWDG